MKLLTWFRSPEVPPIVLNDPAAAWPVERRCPCGEPLLAWEPPYCSATCQALLAAVHIPSGRPVPDQDDLDLPEPVWLAYHAPVRIVGSVVR